jgi:putative phosphoserine phosphatase / 1-acylglycerol-3-phosphate O-acyltransferase
VFTKAMREAGLLSGSAIPGESILTSVFNVIGETLPTMALARQAASLAKGKPVAAARRAAEAAADDLLALVQPYAAQVFQQHRDAGRYLVLATTSPYDMVKPFADRLGFDAVIATRYATDVSGTTYNGSIDGRFVWSTGKLGAVKDWAQQVDVDLKESWFYSDSVYDIPLLQAVGHPVAVNPDARLAVVAVARRWPTLNLDVPAGVPKLPVLSVEPQQVALALCRPELLPFARFDIAGFENIPQSGPAIIVGNHRSYFDVAAMAMAVAKSGRTVRFLGKKEVFDAPIVGQIATAMGGIRVDRGTGSDEPLQAAADALAGSQLVAIMPEGTIPRGPAFFDPVLKGRWGAARLAAQTRVPVIPVGLWGTEKVWPRNSKVPHVWNITSPPAIRIRVGKPVPLMYRSPDADTKRIMKAISALLPPEARTKRTPTADELAASYPSGYKGTPESENARRPGRD